MRTAIINYSIRKELKKMKKIDKLHNNNGEPKNENPQFLGVFDSLKLAFVFVAYGFEFAQWKKNAAMFLLVSLALYYSLYLFILTPFLEVLLDTGDVHYIKLK